MKTLYTFLAAASLLLITPALSHASGPYTDTPTEAASKAPAHEKRMAAKAAKAAKAATKTTKHKKNVALRMRRFTAGLNRAFLVFLGLEDSRSVTSPAKLNRQLHAHQKHLKIKTKLAAKARRRNEHRAR